MSKGQCTLCGDVVESTHRHDFVRCKCGESFLDGGNDYWRASLTMAPIDETFYEEKEFIELLERWDKEDGKEE